MGRGGDLLSPRAGSDLLHSDSRFTPFLSSNFNAAEFASRALAETHTTAQVQIDQLQHGIALLDRQLRQEVLHHQDDLISHSAKLSDTDTALQRISLAVRSLQSVAARVRAEVAEPYHQIAAKTRQLRNLQSTVDMLRHVIHRVKLVQRLRAQLDSGSTGILEVAKTARLLSDIAAVDAEGDLSGIDAVEADAAFLKDAATAVRSQIEVALRSGLAALSQADVGSALQALHNFDELKAAVEAHVDASAAAVERAVSAALDARKLSSVGGVGASAGASAGVRGVVGALQGTTARVHDALWDRLGEALDTVRRAAVETWHLQRVLLKKRDPLSHELFIDVVAPEGGDLLPVDRFWAQVTTSLTDAFSAAFSTQRAGFVRDALANSYPRLAGMMEGLCGAVLRDGAAKDALPPIDPEQAAALLGAASDFEEAYLAGAWKRLEEASMAAFPGSSRALPPAADLQKLVARIHEELKAASAGSDRLAVRAAAAAGDALQAAAERAELMAAGGPDLRSVGGACNPAQLRNISLCNALHEVSRSVAALGPRLPGPAAAELVAPLEAVQAAALDMVTPLFKAMVDALQERILRIHALNLGADDGAEGAVVETSGYMREAARQLAQYRVEYLSKFTPPPGSPSPSVARALCERMAARVLVFFVRHAALVRPLSRPGKLQLAKDAAELEAAVAANLAGPEVLGAPLRALRAFRRLLFTETADLGAGGSAAALLRDLPPTAVLHHLWSRAPPALESPHVRNKLTPAQYSLWLDEHSQDDSLRLVRTALDACAPKLPADDEAAAAVVQLMRTLAGE